MTERSREPGRPHNRPSSDPSTNTPLNPPSPPIEDQLRQLAGYRSADNQGEFPAADELDDLGQLTSTDVYEGQLEADTADDLVDSDNLLAVAEYVEDVDEVVDELRVRDLSRGWGLGVRVSDRDDILSMGIALRSP